MTECGCQLRHEASQCLHFRLELLGLLADLDELGSVLVDVML